MSACACFRAGIPLSSVFFIKIVINSCTKNTHKKTLNKSIEDNNIITIKCKAQSVHNFEVLIFGAYFMYFPTFFIIYYISILNSVQYCILNT